MLGLKGVVLRIAMIIFFCIPYSKIYGETYGVVNVFSSNLEISLVISILAVITSEFIIWLVTQALEKDEEENQEPDPKNDNDKNMIIIGAKGEGKVRHPWDYIPACECGCESPIMHYSNGEVWQPGDDRKDVMVTCPMCNNYIPKKYTY